MMLRTVKVPSYVLYTLRVPLVVPVISLWSAAPQSILFPGVLLHIPLQLFPSTQHDVAVFLASKTLVSFRLCSHHVYDVCLACNQRKGPDVSSGLPWANVTPIFILVCKLNSNHNHDVNRSKSALPSHTECCSWSFTLTYRLLPVSDWSTFGPSEEIILGAHPQLCRNNARP